MTLKSKVEPLAPEPYPPSAPLHAHPFHTLLQLKKFEEDIVPLFRAKLPAECVEMMDKVVASGGHAKPGDYSPACQASQEEIMTAYIKSFTERAATASDGGGGTAAPAIVADDALNSSLFIIASVASIAAGLVGIYACRRRCCRGGKKSAAGKDEGGNDKAKVL